MTTSVCLRNSLLTKSSGGFSGNMCIQILCVLCCCQMKGIIINIFGSGIFVFFVLLSVITQSVHVYRVCVYNIHHIMTRLSGKYAVTIFAPTY